MKLKPFHNATRDFYFLAPDDWEHNLYEIEGNIAQAAAPDGTASVTVSGFGPNPGTTVREFANYRFESREAFLLPVNDEQELANGYYQELEGTYPNATEPTYYVMGASGMDDGFASFSIVTNRTLFEEQRQLFEKIMNSARMT